MWRSGPPEYSKCDIFAHMEKRGLYKNMLPDIRFFREHRFVMFWWEGVPQQKNYKHTCTPPTLLSIDLSMVLSLYTLFVYLTIYWTSLIYVSAYLLSKMFFLHLDRKSPQNYRYYKRSSKWLSVRNALSVFSSKKLVMTNLRVLHYVSL